MSNPADPASTSSTNLPPDFSPSLEVEALQRRQRSDWFLETLVTTFAENGAQITITLQFGGGFLSGTMISAKEYFDIIASQLHKAFTRFGSKAEDVTTIEEFIKSRGTDTPMDEATRDAVMDAAAKAGILPLNGRERAYIHLKDVSVQRGIDTMVPINGGVWRGRISSVEGFILGAP